jgi:hypothetical protein
MLVKFARQLRGHNVVIDNFYYFRGVESTTVIGIHLKTCTRRYQFVLP